MKRLRTKNRSLERASSKRILKKEGTKERKNKETIRRNSKVHNKEMAHREVDINREVKEEEDQKEEVHLEGVTERGGR
jgi:hypothetical protein